jgi:Dolichyl-phosphate-mannose-protein mannosyltransferase
MRILMTDRAPAQDLVLIASLWLLIVLLVNPIGNFPLVDDWSFGRTVKHLLETGQYDSLGWGYMTLVTNILWGALFCLPTGFSFTALRMSTLVASLICLIGAYVLIRDLQQPRWLALLVVFLLGLNPVYLAMSHSFMTDVPFTALSIWTSIFFIRSLRTDSDIEALTATVLAIAATLSRQLALCIPVAFALATLLKSRITMRTLLRALTPLLVCLAAYLIVYRAGLIGIKVDKLVINSLPDLQRLGRTIIYNSYSTLIHLGLFLLPVTVLATKTLRQSAPSRVLVAAGIGTVIMMLLVLARVHSDEGVLLPLFHNILVKSGVGPTIIRDVWLLKLDNLHPLPTGFWIIVTSMGIGGAVLLIAALTLHTWELVPALRSGTWQPAEAIRIFALLTPIIYFLLLLPAPLFFDRYVIPMMPFLVVALLSLNERASMFSLDAARALRIAAFAVVGAFGLFSIAGTRDYLTWNRIRWAALEELMSDSQVDAKEIDGGFEFNGFYLYNPPFIERTLVSSISPWWVYRDTYQIGFGPVPGYQIMKEYTYQRWLPWRVQKVVVLRKQ